jgi:hypothetical protein
MLERHQEALMHMTEVPKDLLDSLDAQMYLDPGDDDPRRPELLPKELWRYVQKGQRAKVKERWATFPHERLVEVSGKLLGEIKVCLERPQQKPYIEAQCMANLDRFYHVDPMNPAPVKGYTYRIFTNTDRPTVATRTLRFSPLQLIYMQLRCNELIWKNYVQPSKSAYRANIMRMQHADKVKTFQDK